MKQLRDDLTFEEFSALARRTPESSISGRYGLRSYIFDPATATYPEFKIHQFGDDDANTFDSLEEAENYMRRLVADNKSVDFYCHHILELIYSEEDRDWSVGRDWLYNADGSLEDFTLTRDEGLPEDRHFFGRPEEWNRFSSGDIVELWTGDSVRLAVLSSSCNPVELCWEIYQRTTAKGIGYILDSSDETCLIYDGPGFEGHDHVAPTALMRPRFPVDPGLAEEIRSWMDY